MGFALSFLLFFSSLPIGPFPIVHILTRSKMVRRFIVSAVAATLLSTLARAHPADFSKREQPGVPETPKLNNLRPLEWGDINFIHTTDIHGEFFLFYMIGYFTHSSLFFLLTHIGWLEVCFIMQETHARKQNYSKKLYSGSFTRGIIHRRSWWFLLLCGKYLLLL